MRIWLLTMAAFATWAAPVAGQQPDSAGPGKAVPAFPAARADSRVETRYDRFADSSIAFVRTNFYDVPSFKQIFTNSEKPEVFFTATYPYAGRALADTVRQFYVFITTKTKAGTQAFPGRTREVARDNVRAEDGTLRLILDGTERMSFPARLTDRDVHFGDIITEAQRVYAVAFPVPTFLHIVAASQIEGRVGSAEFKLGARQLAPLRDLAASANPVLLGKSR